MKSPSPPKKVEGQVKDTAPLVRGYTGTVVQENSLAAPTGMSNAL